MDLSPHSPRGRFLKRLCPQMAQFYAELDGQTWSKSFTQGVIRNNRLISTLRPFPGRIFSNPLNRIALPLPKAALLTGRDLDLAGLLLRGLLLLPIAMLLIGRDLAGLFLSLLQSLSRMALLSSLDLASDDGVM